MSSQGRPHTRGLAIACGAAIAVAGAAMIFAQKETKFKESKQSIYQDPSMPGSDARLKSTDIAGVVTNKK